MGTTYARWDASRSLRNVVSFLQLHFLIAPQNTITDRTSTTFGLIDLAINTTAAATTTGLVVEGGRQPDVTQLECLAEASYTNHVSSLQSLVPGHRA